MTYTTKVCQRCGKEYQPASSTQKYCKECVCDARREWKRLSNAVWSQANPEKVRKYSSRASAKWAKNNQEKVREERAKWNQANPEAHTKWNQANPEKCRAASDKYRKANLEKVKKQQALYRQDHPEVSALQKAKRRTLGFIPMNASFAGCARHHVDKEQVIHMPGVLHRSIQHNLIGQKHTGRNMAKVTAVAYNFLFKQEVEAAMAKVLA